MKQQTIEVHIRGMDCAECTMHVQHAIATVPGVESVEVYLASEKAVVQLDPELVDLSRIQKAVEAAGYAVPTSQEDQIQRSAHQDFTSQVMRLLGLVFGVVIFVVVVGEWLGLFEVISGVIPWPVGLAIVILVGYPVFFKVIRATLNRQIISHTLMTVGLIAAMVVGEWATAVMVAFFMRVGDYVEGFTTERARRAVKDLSAMAPQTARLERDGIEVELPISQVAPGDTVIVRPGEKIPVDGEVTGGHATVDQASITGESMPLEAGPGAKVYAATLVSLGSLRIKTIHVGQDTTFGKVIKLVEEAEGHRADVQRLADKFSAYYLPLVAAVAALTFILSRDPMATTAVLVVACSCAFALATPIAMLASIGAGAKHGLMIKGGKYLEILEGADVILIDKTGTLTLGKPRITDILDLREVLGISDWEFGITKHDLQMEGGDGGEDGVGLGTYNPDPQAVILQLAASAERYSEHPLAEAVRAAARERGLSLFEPESFDSLPGLGLQARINGHQVAVGNRRMFQNENGLSAVEELESQGKTLSFVEVDGKLVGLLAAADTLRPEVPRAIEDVRKLGVRHVELLTGDNQRSAAALAQRLGVPYQAELLPEDKIAIVKKYQAQGHKVVMVGDGVNDAPALAQADVGIAMGAAGSDVAIEAAHIALMREDWTLVPEVFRIAQRTMRVVKMNIGFTAVYNLVGLTLAALGYLPPVLAAAAQSLPDLGILANSSRLLRQK
ncbi:MAG: heavy metal translocating P-type ATPase [Anaerolineales bacterium]